MAAAATAATAATVATVAIVGGTIQQGRGRPGVVLLLCWLGRGMAGDGGVTMPLLLLLCVAVGFLVCGASHNFG